MQEMQAAYADAAVASWAPPPSMQVPAHPTTYPGEGSGEPSGFEVGDLVRLKGQAANPKYEGQSYVVQEDMGDGRVMVKYKHSEKVTSRLAFDARFLEFVEHAPAPEEVPLTQAEHEVAPANDGAARDFAAPGYASGQKLQAGDWVRVSGLDACPRHNGRTGCLMVPLMPNGFARVKLEDASGGADVLDVPPEYLELVDLDPADQPRQGYPAPDAVSIYGLQAGDEVRIRALPSCPQQHCGKVGTVELADDGVGTTRVKLHDMTAGVTRLVINPAHLEYLDGREVVPKGAPQVGGYNSGPYLAAAAAVASLPQAAKVQAGDQVRIRPTFSGHQGKVAVVEMADDGTGSACVRLEDAAGGVVRLIINAMHLEPA